MARTPAMDPCGFASASLSAAAASGKVDTGQRGEEVSRDEEEPGVVRWRLHLTEAAARDHSIEAALDRLISRWWKQQTREEKLKDPLEQQGVGGGRGREEGQERRGGEGGGRGGEQGGGVDRKLGDNDAMPAAVAGVAAAAVSAGAGEEVTEEKGMALCAPAPPFPSALSVPPVWVIHAPPRDTVGDLCNGKGVSKATMILPSLPAADETKGCWMLQARSYFVHIVQLLVPFACLSAPTPHITVPHPGLRLTHWHDSQTHQYYHHVTLLTRLGLFFAIS